jgi:ABC-type uncharacterized transport system permease subunit
MSLIRIEKNPSGRQLIVFGIAWLLFFGLWGGSARRHGHPALGETLLVAATVVPLAGAASRKFLRHIFVGMSYVTYPVGFVISYIVLALVYFLAVTPIGLTMRVFGNDPLSRKFVPGATTYWKPRNKNRTPESYFNQS